MKALRIGVDMDGVLADFDNGWRDAYERHFGVRPGPSTSWDIAPLTRFSSEGEFWTWMRRDHSDLFSDLEPYTGALAAICELALLGHEVVIITSKPEWAARSAYTWLGRWNVPTREVHVTHDKTTVDCDVYIDDGPHNLEALSKAKPDAVVVRWVQPWNRPVPGVVDCDSWGQFKAVVETVSAAKWADQPRLIGLAGYARSGKDTVGGFLAEAGFQRLSFADKLREFALAVNPLLPPRYGSTARLADVVESLGWEKVKDAYPEVRGLLQRIGTEAGRNILGENVWVDAAMSQVKPGGSYVFTDVRFPNELEAIRAAGGEVWRIERPGFGPINGHESETALDDYHFDRCLYNAGTLEQLRDLALADLAVAA